MDGIDVRIVRMGARRLAFVKEAGRTEGEHERIAGRKIRRWARDRKLLDGPGGFHWFGANEPPPAKPGDEYGYLSGVTVPAEVGPDGEVRIRDLPAATFAVTRFRGLSNIGARWRALYAWVEQSPDFRVAGHGLEELLAPMDDEEVDRHPDSMVFDLWLPVAER